MNEMLPLPLNHSEPVPDMVHYVRSPRDPWMKTFRMVVKDLVAGVPVVYVLDLGSRSLIVFDDDGPPRVYSVDKLPMAQSYITSQRR